MLECARKVTAGQRICHLKATARAGRDTNAPGCCEVHEGGVEGFADHFGDHDKTWPRWEMGKEAENSVTSLMVLLIFIHSTHGQHLVAMRLVRLRAKAKSRQSTRLASSFLPLKSPV